MSTFVPFKKTVTSLKTWMTRSGVRTSLMWTWLSDLHLEGLSSVRRVTKIRDEVRFLFNACETTQSCDNAKAILVSATHVALHGWRDLWRVQASAVGRRCEAEQLIQAASREPKQTTRELQSAMPKKTGGHQNGDAPAAQPNYEQQAIGEDWNSQPEVLTEQLSPHLTFHRY